MWLIPPSSLLASERKKYAFLFSISLSLFYFVLTNKLHFIWLFEFTEIKNNRLNGYYLWLVDEIIWYYMEIQRKNLLYIIRVNIVQSVDMFLYDSLSTLTFRQIYHTRLLWLTFFCEYVIIFPQDKTLL